MRRIWRITRVFFALLWEATYVHATVGRRPEAARDAHRARAQQRAGRKLARLFHFDIRVDGDLPPEGGAYLAVSNHISAIDPFLIATQMLTAIVGKAELAKMPVVGWICRAAGLIFVARSRRMQTGDFVGEVQHRLREGVRVLIFPEGTTGNGLHVMPFKTGGFAAVADMPDAAVLPLYLDVARIDGAPAAEHHPHITWSAERQQSMLQHFWNLARFRQVEIVLRVGAPIPTAGQDRKALARAAQTAVEHLAERGQ